LNDAKYTGLDLHQATICAAVLEGTGKLVLECTLETKTATVLQCPKRLHGSLHVCLEEGACAAWLHDLLKPHVTDLLMCDQGETLCSRPRARMIGSTLESWPDCGEAGCFHRSITE
jgi:hypothetical protein